MAQIEDKKKVTIDDVVNMANRINVEIGEQKLIQYLPMWISHNWITVTFKITPLVCECGAEACNTTHSDWCPKFDKLYK
jgi:hypothetical protein